MNTRAAIGFASLMMLCPAVVLAERTSSNSGASHQLHQHMVQSSEKSKSMDMTGDVDRDFAKMMADHHRSGIEMAEMYTKHAKSDELKELAQNMIQEQQKDLRSLDQYASGKQG